MESESGLQGKLLMQQMLEPDIVVVGETRELLIAKTGGSPTKCGGKAIQNSTINPRSGILQPDGTLYPRKVTR